MKLAALVSLVLWLRGADAFPPSEMLVALARRRAAAPRAGAAGSELRALDEDTKFASIALYAPELQSAVVHPRTRHVCLNDDGLAAELDAEEAVAAEEEAVTVAAEEDLAALCHALHASARALDGAAALAAHARLAARLRRADLAQLLTLPPPARVAALCNLHHAIRLHAARLPPRAAGISGLSGVGSVARYRVGTVGDARRFAPCATDARGGVCLSASNTCCF